MVRDCGAGREAGERMVRQGTRSGRPKRLVRQSTDDQNGKRMVREDAREDQQRLVRASAASGRRICLVCGREVRGTSSRCAHSPRSCSALASQDKRRIRGRATPAPLTSSMRSVFDASVQAVRKILGPLLIFAAGAAATVALFAYTRDDLERDARLRFESQAVDAKHIIERRLHSYVGVTYGLKALFAANDALSRAEFSQYVSSLKLAQNYPGFEVLNYARHIRLDEKRLLEEEMRREHPGFKIRPPGDRPEYHVLVYLEPMRGNEFAFGLDIGTTGAPGRAINLLRDTGGLVSSGRLLRAKDGYVGLAMRLTIYRNGMPLNTVEERRAAFLGTVGAGYNVRKLMAGVLDETTMIAMRYRLYDAGPVAEARSAKPSLLFDSAQTLPGAPQDNFAVSGARPMFETVLPLQLAGRNWELHFSSPANAFMDRSESWLP